MTRHLRKGRPVPRVTFYWGNELSGLANDMAALRRLESYPGKPALDAGHPGKLAERSAAGATTARLAAEFSALRASQGWTLDQLAKRSGVSRAALSRLEHGEVSPSADVLVRLCAAHGLRPSQLMARVEEGYAPLVPVDTQSEWRDPQRAVSTRHVSPAAPGLSGDVSEWRFGPGVVTELGASQSAARECHLLMQQGRLRVKLDQDSPVAERGDMLRFHQRGPIQIEVLGETGVRFLLFSLST